MFFPVVLFMVLSILWHTPIPFLAGLLVFTGVAFVNLSIKGVTKSIIFEDSQVIITKRGRLPQRIDLEQTRVYTVTVKGWWSGITFEYGQDSHETIWTYEFDKESWWTILKYLGRKITFSKPGKDYTGQRF